MDPGARVLGEVAFGLNYEIDRFTRNILFDEKIGGTMHLALGSGFPQAGGQNTSGLHWDLICDLREDGEVYADGELVWKAGRFLAEPAPRWSSARGIAARAARGRARRLLDGGAAGDLVLHRRPPAAAPLVREVWRRVLDAGAHPHARTRRRRRAGAAPRREGTDAQLDWMSPLAQGEVERADVG